MRPNENVRYMSRKRWDKLVLESLASGKMWKHIHKGDQEVLVKADDDRCYVVMIATETPIEGTLEVKYI